MCLFYPCPGIPGYPASGVLPTMQAAAGVPGSERISAAAAAAAAYYAADYGAIQPGTAGLTPSQIAAAATGAVSIARSDTSPMPLSSSPMHRDQFTHRTAGQAGTHTLSLYTGPTTKQFGSSLQILARCVKSYHHRSEILTHRAAYKLVAF